MSRRKYNIELTGLNGLIVGTSYLSTQAETVMSISLWEGAKIIADATKPLIPYQTGGLQGAYGVSKHKRKGDEVATYLGFGGQGFNQYKYGIPNSNLAYSYIANTLTNGSSRAPGMRKQDFIAQGLKKSKVQAEQAVKIRAEAEIQKILDQNRNR